MSVLVDTDIIIDFLRQSDDAVAFIGSLGPKPAVSVASVAELCAGVKSRREEALIEGILRDSRVLPLTTEIACVAGQHLRHFGKSHGLDDLDALIAATAQHHDLEFATLNVKHFPMFKRLKAAY